MDPQRVDGDFSVSARTLFLAVVLFRYFEQILPLGFSELCIAGI